MSELEEFADALLDQIAVETDEEKVIADLAEKIACDTPFDVKFEPLEDAAKKFLDPMREKMISFTGLDCKNTKLEFTNLDEFKALKGKKVAVNDDSRRYVDNLFAAVAAADVKGISNLIKEDRSKFFVYSTYAKAYLSKISTTYGDYMDGTIYLNKFVLSNYPQIILYRQGEPFDQRFTTVNSGYMGALKMTILEELIHSGQEKLHSINKKASLDVNLINEELAGIINLLDDDTASSLYEYLQLQTVPNDFPIAKRANLFFMLNPDNFIVNVLGPDVMTFNRVEIDPKISKMVPELLDIYQRWLEPIQSHHAVFTAMEGMAEFVVENVLEDDLDFVSYLSTFAGTDISSYRVRKSMGRDFTRIVYKELGRKAFELILDNPPTTRELKEPKIYLSRV
ncbi:MAG: hypothetical protein K8823_535 [Cenarchaeum symbiont of Oopsacas minuta]|nr:hypothetical protein [Cenarchaeum symbiont of Oopsacas minuta]